MNIMFMNSIVKYGDNMFDTLNEIRQNKYINDLDNTAEEFGLSATYVNYNKDIDTDARGIYFVCGLDHNRIKTGDFDIKEVLKHNKRDRNFFNYGIMVFPLKDCAPFATHQLILEHCRNAEFVKMVYKEYQKPIPPKISIASLTSMKMLYANARNPDISPAERARYEESFEKCFELEDAYHNPQSADYKKMKFKTDGHYDTGKGPVANLFKRAFSRTKNNVSLEHLFSVSPSLEHVLLNVKIVKQVKEELKKHPEILYWMSKPEGIVLNVQEGQGFGPTKEDNDTRTVDLAYSSFYKSEMNEILNRVCYPEAWNTNLMEMCNKYGDVYMVQIPENEYYNFRSLCGANNIEFCMDAAMAEDKMGELSMIVPYRDIKMVDAILSRLSGETEDYHMNLAKLSNDENQPVSIDCSVITDIEGDMLRRISEAFPDGNYQIINDSFVDYSDESR